MPDLDPSEDSSYPQGYGDVQAVVVSAPWPYLLYYQTLTTRRQEEFFTVEGQTVLPMPDAPGPDRRILGVSLRRQASSTLSTPLQGVPLSRTFSRISLATVASTDTFLNHSADPRIPLRELLDVISRHRSLQHAQIVRADAYQGFNGQVIHRFIILELERDGRQKIWLRIDRGREKGSVRKFLAEGATSLAADRVSFVSDSAWFHELTDL